MKVRFETPNVDIVNKNNNAHINRAKILFKDYYQHLKKDILSDGIVNLEQYKEEFANLLKIIYKRILTKNKNSLFNNITTENIKKNDILQLQDLEDEAFNLTNQLIDTIANQRTDIMFENLLDELITIKNKNTAKANQEINSLSSKISNIDNSLLALSFGLIAPFTNEKKKKLKKQKDDLLKQLNKRTEDKDKYIANLISNEYDERIVNNKTNMQAMNEVDNFDGEARNNESNVLNQIVGLALASGEKLKPKKKKYKEWQATLDEKTRRTHAEAHGQVVEINEKFAIRNPNTGIIEYANRPKGEGLSPENSINCRCISKEIAEFEI